MSGFVFSQYANMLNRIIDSGYVITTVSDGKRLFYEGVDKVCLLSHIVEASIKKAKQLLDIENAINSQIWSTWFFMVNNPIYNLFSDCSIDIVRKIISCGNEVGMIVNANDGEIGVVLAEQMLRTKINALFAKGEYDRPRVRLWGEKFLVNNPPFLNEIFVFSNAGGCWDFGNPAFSDMISSGKPIFIQNRPIWWNETLYTSPFEVYREIEKFDRVEYGMYLKEEILFL